MSQLCQLSDVQTYLGNTTSATAAALTALIGNVSAAIETFCNTTFELATYTDTYNGNGRPSQYLHEGPVVSVSSVSINGIVVAQSADAVSAGYVYDDRMVYLRGACVPERFTRGVQNVTITYEAGYSATPPGINQACVLWVADLFAKRNRIDKKSETLGQQQTEAYDLSDMPQAVKTLLRPYVRFTA